VSGHDAVSSPSKAGPHLYHSRPPEGKRRGRWKTTQTSPELKRRRIPKKHLPNVGVVGKRPAGVGGQSGTRVSACPPSDISTTRNNDHQPIRSITSERVRVVSQRPLRRHGPLISVRARSGRFPTTPMPARSFDFRSSAFGSFSNDPYASTSCAGLPRCAFGAGFQRPLYVRSL
jgi:hypothetical protein